MEKFDGCQTSDKYPQSVVKYIYNNTCL